LTTCDDFSGKSRRPKFVEMFRTRGGWRRLVVITEDKSILFDVESKVPKMSRGENENQSSMPPRDLG
jgi:hypothetical protein